MTIDEAQVYLDELCNNLPAEIFARLNGGVVLSEHSKLHPEEPGLFIRGEYNNHPGSLGRYVVIYYSSIAATTGNDYEFRDALKEVLHHELTHHLESMAGDYSLEEEDAEFMREYRDSKY